MKRSYFSRFQSSLGHVLQFISGVIDNPNASVISLDKPMVLPILIYNSPPMSMIC